MIFCSMIFDLHEPHKHFWDILIKVPLILYHVKNSRDKMYLKIYVSVLWQKGAYFISMMNDTSYHTNFLGFHETDLVLKQTES